MSYANTTEQAISDARTAVVNIFDEDLPEVSASFDTRDSIQDRLILAMKKMDLASDTLRELSWAYDRVTDEVAELKAENELLTEQVDATEFGLLAQSLLHELRGRMMTDSPEQVVWWIEHALVTVLAAPTPDDTTDANRLLTAATWGG